MKAHIGVDSDSGLVHTVVGTAANVDDVTQADKLVHGEEDMVSRDAGYTGIEKRAEHADRQVIWQSPPGAAPTRGLISAAPLYNAKRKIEKVKARYGPRWNTRSG